MKILWLTSCAADMWNASGRTLLESFRNSGSDGHMFLTLEGVRPEALAQDAQLTVYNLTTDPFLRAWLTRNAVRIPRTLGGKAKEPLCKCRRRPLSPHDKAHHMPCLGHWFNKNHSRWFRKIASLAYVDKLYKLQTPEREFDAVIWVDSDCIFKKKVTEHHAKGWFMHHKACFYLKSKRPVLEGGIIGYSYAGGAGPLVANIIERYSSGRYANDKRWDDSYQIQLALAETKVDAIDIAYEVGEHAAVVEHSSLSAWLAHDKGRHGRKLHLMT